MAFPAFDLSQRQGTGEDCFLAEAGTRDVVLFLSLTGGVQQLWGVDRTGGVELG